MTTEQAHSRNPMHLDGDEEWIEGPWSTIDRDRFHALLVATATRAGDPEVSLDADEGHWLSALAASHAVAPPRHRRWLALAGVLALGRAAEQDIVASTEALALWHDAVRRDPGRHPEHRAWADPFRRVIGSALRKLALAAPAVAERLVLGGLAARPLATVQRHALATFRYVGATPSPAVLEAAIALLAEAEAEHLEDRDGHITAGVQGLIDRTGFVRAVFAAGAGLFYQTDLLAPLSRARRRALCSTEPRRSHRLVAVGTASSSGIRSLHGQALVPALRYWAAHAPPAQQLDVARAPALARDRDAIARLLEHGDRSDFETGAGRCLAAGMDIDPAWAERALLASQPERPMPATLELLARGAPDRLFDHLPAVFDAADLDRNPPRSQAVVGSIITAGTLPEDLHARLDRLGTKMPEALLPAILLRPTEARLSAFAEGRTSLGALLAAPDCGSALQAHLERVDPTAMPFVHAGWLALERWSRAPALRDRWLGSLCDALHDPRRAAWASQTLAYLGPRPAVADAIVAGMRAMGPERPSGALVRLLVEMGDLRAFDLVLEMPPGWMLGLLKVLLPLDRERVLALVTERIETLAPGDSDRVVHLGEVAAVAESIPNWFPKSARRDIVPLRFAYAEVSDDERSALLAATVDHHGWHDVATSIARARDALRNFPEQVRPILQRTVDHDDPRRVFVAELALRRGPSDDQLGGAEPTDPIDVTPQRWRRWMATARTDYVAPFHPSWVARVLGR